MQMFFKLKITSKNTGFFLKLLSIILHIVFQPSFNNSAYSFLAFFLFFREYTYVGSNLL